MADTAILLEIITYIFQRTPLTADCGEPLKAIFGQKSFLGLSFKQKSIFLTSFPLSVP